jgi:signal-transduction protein with cAMP-binding, CBS, and nucleotidyltransferase domain
MKINDCKLRDVISCDVADNIIAVANKLRKEKERHIIVTRNKKPVGIISTTDINNRVVAVERNLKKTNAEDVMTSNLLIKDENEPIVGTYVEMIKKHVFSCPVTKKDKLIGAIDLKELMNHIVKLKA